MNKKIIIKIIIIIVIKNEVTIKKCVVTMNTPLLTLRLFMPPNKR